MILSSPVYVVDPILVQRPTRSLTALPSGPSLAPSLSSSLNQQLPFGMADYGQPGGLAQFRGTAARSEDIQVQTEGMSLNPAYGGGLDLSTLPPFLWSGGKYDWASQSGVFSPRSTAGSLQLRLWTASEPYRTETVPTTYLLMGNGSRLQSWTAGGVRTESAGLLLGIGGGQSFGPAGSASLRFYSNSESTRSVTVHVLGSSLDQESLGSRFYPTPQARQQSTRATTWLQARWQFTPHIEGQFQLGFDRASTSYRETKPSAPFDQLGFSWTWDQAWKLRLNPNWSLEPSQSLRLLNYSTSTIPSEQDWANTHRMAVRWESDDAQWIHRPSIGESTGGAKTELIAGWDTVFNLDESNRLQFSAQSPVKHPNTQERFFSLQPFAVANPDLKSERLLQLGLNFSHAGAVEFDAILQTQRRWGTHRNFATLLGNQRINGAPSWLSSATVTGRYARGWFQPELGATFSTSSVEGSTLPLAYASTLTLTHSIGFYPLHQWCIRPFFRLQSQAWDDFAEAYNPAAFTGGLESWFAFHGFQFGLRGDHVIGGRQEWILGYPIAERLVTLMIRGQF